MTDLATETRRALQALHAATEATERLNERHALEIARIPAIEAGVRTDRQILDELVAWARGGPPPSLTLGAQAILARHAQEARRA